MEIENGYSEFNKYIEKNEKIDLEKSNLKSFLKEIESKIQKMKEVLVIDRFEEDFAICENRETKEFKMIKKCKLPKEAQEGSVLKWSNGKYEINIEEQKKIEQRIKEKMDNLWE